ncbi:MAG: hypothetical protein HYX61_08550 [Gammaproteobacteria bacterium]|jgi:hypothetical protein|nr:hypothetical protein [Gammaproteobacteria bacterium]
MIQGFDPSHLPTFTFNQVNNILLLANECKENFKAGDFYSKDCSQEGLNYFIKYILPHLDHLLLQKNLFQEHLTTLEQFLEIEKGGVAKFWGHLVLLCARNGKIINLKDESEKACWSELTEKLPKALALRDKKPALMKEVFLGFMGDLTQNKCSIVSQVIHNFFMLAKSLEPDERDSMIAQVNFWEHMDAFLSLGLQLKGKIVSVTSRQGEENILLQELIIKLMRSYAFDAPFDNKYYSKFQFPNAEALQVSTKDKMKKIPFISYLLEKLDFKADVEEITPHSQPATRSLHYLQSIHSVRQRSAKVSLSKVEFETHENGRLRSQSTSTIDKTIVKNKQ